MRVCLEHLGSLHFRGGSWGEEERRVSTKVVNLLLTLLNRSSLAPRVPAMSFTKLYCSDCCLGCPYLDLRPTSPSSFRRKPRPLELSQLKFGDHRKTGAEVTQKRQYKIQPLIFNFLSSCSKREEMEAIRIKPPPA